MGWLDSLLGRSKPKQADLDALLRGADPVDSGDAAAEFSRDEYGYSWLTSRRAPDDVAALVNDLHAVNTSLEAQGFGPALLCSLVSFADASGRSLALVYLYKRGTFYPFAPVASAGQQRDNLLELQVRDLLTGEIAIERDLTRWLALWGAPGV